MQIKKKIGIQHCILDTPIRKTFDNVGSSQCLVKQLRILQGYVCSSKYFIVMALISAHQLFYHVTLWEVFLILALCWNCLKLTSFKLKKKNPHLLFFDKKKNTPHLFSTILVPRTKCNHFLAFKIKTKFQKPN